MKSKKNSKKKSTPSRRRIAEIRRYVNGRLALEAGWEKQTRTSPDLDDQDRAATRAMVDLLTVVDAAEKLDMRSRRRRDLRAWRSAREGLLHALRHIVEMECPVDHDGPPRRPCPRRAAKEAIDGRSCSICLDARLTREFWTKRVSAWLDRNCVAVQELGYVTVSIVSRWTAFDSVAKLTPDLAAEILRELGWERSEKRRTVRELERALVDVSSAGVWGTERRQSPRLVARGAESTRTVRAYVWTKPGRT